MWSRVGTSGANMSGFELADVWSSRRKPDFMRRYFAALPFEAARLALFASRTPCMFIDAHFPSLPPQIAGEEQLRITT
jgi:hypothetical protein